MGEDVNVHDQFALESMGEIQDRTKEHLGQSDKAIVAYRRMLFKAIDDVAEGRAPPLVVDAAAASALRGPGVIDAIGPVEGWQAFWRRQDEARRTAAPWLAAVKTV
jgi:hypothetical protein